MNSEHRREIKFRERLHNKYKRNKTLIALNKFKQQQNKINNMSKYARQSFYENIYTTIDKLYRGDPKSY